MAKGKRFDSIQDVYNKALLERYGLIHYIHALDRYLHTQHEMFKILRTEGHAGGS